MVHPSQADALPTAHTHALGADVLAVATRVGGIPEIVGEEAGVLVRAANPAALAAAVRALADDAPRRLQMGEAARARFAERFEGTAWARRLRTLYDEVLATTEPRALSPPQPGPAALPPVGRNIAPTRWGMG